MGEPCPILISSPHSGLAFPHELQSKFKPRFLKRPPDTDWWVDRLYDFAPSMGITLISAKWNRYVIDLNRSPDNSPLYHDARMQTELVPKMTFDGEELYLKSLPKGDEVRRRMEAYYRPYYREVESQLKNLRRLFPNVLFFDAHSIRRTVSSIRPEPFPDLILGNQNGATACERIIQTALYELEASPYSSANNNPFRGGNLTRHFGRPNQGVHALQLEMSQDLYMDGQTYNEERAEGVRLVLKKMLARLIQVVQEIS